MPPGSHLEHYNAACSLHRMLLIRRYRRLTGAAVQEVHSSHQSCQDYVRQESHLHYLAESSKSAHHDSPIENAFQGDSAGKYDNQESAGSEISARPSVT